jgi:nuclease S1
MILALSVFLLWPCFRVFGWGYEGHEIIALIAEHYMTKPALAEARDLLGGESLDQVASWADEYRHDHPETGPWHYIDIPLDVSRIDMPRDCPEGNCVIAKTRQFLAILKSPNADRAD